ncbi:DNA-directed RNA polymerase I subunit RPA43 isoform X1 [Agelaius phoeniceus]|uniref:DNA-directed RNA polymerase I subunit RPA43 isoform X1 n=1 Tax=Agelaius phoeniceus TaxID=39638 RepID=UPI004054A094
MAVPREPPAAPAARGAAPALPGPQALRHPRAAGRRAPALLREPAGRAGGLRQHQSGGGARRHLRRSRIHPPGRGGGLHHLQPQEGQEAGVTGMFRMLSSSVPPSTRAVHQVEACLSVMELYGSQNSFKLVKSLAQHLWGVINKVAPSHIGCLIHGCFNASIPKPEQMSPVQWQELGLKIGDELKFQVLHLDSDTAGVFFIRGGLTKSSMRPKKSDAVPESTNGDEIQKLDHQENGLNNSGEVNVTEEPLNEMDNLGRENEEPGVDAVNGLCDDKKKKKKKKKDKDKDKQGEQELVLPTSDSSGYQSDHKKSKKKKRKHCDEVEESELSQLSEKPKAKKKRTKV